MGNNKDHRISLLRGRIPILPINSCTCGCAGMVDSNHRAAAAQPQSAAKVLSLAAAKLLAQFCAAVQRKDILKGMAGAICDTLNFFQISRIAVFYRRKKRCTVFMTAPPSD